MAAPALPARRFRAWCYTLNNPTADDERRLQGLLCRYHVYGRERGANGTPHLQGFIYFSDGHTFVRAKNKLGPRVHLERARGSPAQAAAYCKKDLDFFENGELPRQGHRTDFDELKAELVETHGGDVDSFLMSAPQMSWGHYRILDRVAPLFSPRRRRKTRIIWCHGATGTGKSAWAFGRFPEAFPKIMTTRFWDGYHGQATVVLEDLRSDHFGLSELLRLFDRYPLSVNVKGRSRAFNSKRIVVTTPQTPEEFWVGYQTDESVEQLKRRIDHTLDFGSIPHVVHPRAEPYIEVLTEDSEDSDYA